MTNDAMLVRMCADRDVLRRRISNLESGHVRIGNGPHLIRDDVTEPTLERLRELLADQEARIAAYEQTDA